jgi:hypothetical protein
MPLWMVRAFDTGVKKIARAAHHAAGLVDHPDDAREGRAAERAAPAARAVPQAGGARGAQAAVAAVDEHGVRRLLPAHQAGAAVLLFAAGAVTVGCIIGTAFLDGGRMADYVAPGCCKGRRAVGLTSCWGVLQ